MCDLMVRVQSICNVLGVEENADQIAIGFTMDD